MTQAQSHHIKLQELKEMNKIIQVFSKQYEQISEAGSKAIEAWKNNWTRLSQQVNQVEKGNEYQTALQERPLDTQVLKAINKAIGQNYGFKLEGSHTTNNPSLQNGNEAKDIFPEGPNCVLASTEYCPAFLKLTRMNNSMSK